MNTNDYLYEYIDIKVGKRVKSSSPMGKVRFNYSNSKSNAGGSGGSARNYIIKNMGKAPEAMLKITGSSNDISKISSHINYISRNGEVEVRNQEGDILSGKEELKNELDAWKSLGITNESGKNRESLHIILSMPKGTNPKGLLRAVNNFAQQELPDNNYLYAQHLDTENPHVHLCVSIRDMKGNRLNPRKEDIANWRKIFAEKLREQGIDAVATTRKQRMKVRKGYKQIIKHIDQKLIKDEKLSDVTKSRLDQIDIALDKLENIKNPYDAKIKKTITQVELNYKKILKDKNSGLDSDALSNIENLVRNYHNGLSRKTTNDILLEKMKIQSKIKNTNHKGKEHERDR